MSDHTIYFSSDYEWAVDCEQNMVAVQPAPLAVLGGDGESFEGYQVVLRELGMKLPVEGVEPPTVQGVCLLLVTPTKARVEVTGLRGVSGGWDVPHGDQSWSERVRSEGEVLLLITQNAIDPKAPDGLVLTQVRLQADIASGAVLSGYIPVRE
ncbi:MAG TPA: hypothetical protein VIM49_12570 [Dermatophilaceae bacterium]